MVKTLKEKDILEAWFGKKSKTMTTPKQTKAASKLIAEQQEVKNEVIEDLSTKGRWWNKGKAKTDVAVKGKKKAKALRRGAAEVVLGRSKILVPVPEEMQRKRIEDVVACGRVVKSIVHPATRKSCLTTAKVESG